MLSVNTMMLFSKNVLLSAMAGMVIQGGAQQSPAAPLGHRQRHPLLGLFL
jgi:hypothetical protein